MKKFFLSALTSTVLFGSSAFAMEPEDPMDSNPAMRARLLVLEQEFPSMKGPLLRARVYGEEGYHKEVFKIYEGVVKDNCYSREVVGTAHYELANAYYYADGIQEDVKAAMGHYKKSADLGNPIGQYMWGQHCFYGTHVFQDVLQGLHYFDLAEKQGYVAAQNTINAIIKDYEAQAKKGSSKAASLLGLISFKRAVCAGPNYEPCVGGGAVYTSRGTVDTGRGL